MTKSALHTAKGYKSAIVQQSNLIRITRCDAEIGEAIGGKLLIDTEYTFIYSQF